MGRRGRFRNIGMDAKLHKRTHRRVETLRFARATAPARLAVDYINEATKYLKIKDFRFWLSANEPTIVSSSSVFPCFPRVVRGKWPSAIHAMAARMNREIG